MSENGEIYTAGKNFTLPPAVTAWTNSTSDHESELNRSVRAPSKIRGVVAAIKISTISGLLPAIGCVQCQQRSLEIVSRTKFLLEALVSALDGSQFLEENLSSIDNLQFCEKRSSVDQHMLLILQQNEGMFTYKSKYLSKIL